MPDLSLPALIQGLLDPASYPHAPRDVELRQTHISYVLLAGDRVYKIKKPVALGFVDYSTPARRAYYCRREVALNRRLAPEVYLGVVPIVERAGRPWVGGRGTVLERAVEMVRLPDDGMLPAVLARHEATPALMEEIAARLAPFHAAAASTPRIARYGRPGAVRRTLEETLERIAPYVGRTLSSEQYARLREWTGDALEQLAPLLAQRAAAGRVRDGHGDLHASSICITDRVVIFDCIEFSAALRCNDVASEVAFLAMDLDRHACADLAEAFVDAYVRRSGDAALRRPLLFFRCQRALVRGLVASIAASEPEQPAAERERQRALATTYFDLAFYGYTGAAPRPLLLLIGGLPASGKSVLARQLAARLAAVALHTDVLRKRRAGLAPTARPPAALRDALYAPQSTAATYAALLEEARGWLERGVSVVLDGTYRRAADRRAAAALASAHGVPWLAIECHCPATVARERLAARAEAPGEASDADWTIYEQQAREWEPWAEIPPERYLAVDTTQPLESSVGHVLRVVARVC